MKIRNGFVSNSSSSSFICNAFSDHYKNGKAPIKFDEKEIKRKLEAIFKFCVETDIISTDIYKDISEEGNFSKMFGSVYKISPQEFESIKEDSFCCLDDNNLEWNENMFMIESADDNSVPSEMFEIIKTIFDAIMIRK